MMVAGCGGGGIWSRKDHDQRRSPMTTYPQKISFGELRASGVDAMLIYCWDHHCSHHVTVSADRWADHVRLSDLNRLSPAAPAASAAPRCGRIGIRLRRMPNRGWQQPFDDPIPLAHDRVIE